MVELRDLSGLQGLQRAGCRDAQMPLRVENFTRTITDHAVDFIAERAVAVRTPQRYHAFLQMLAVFVDLKSIK